MNAVAYVRVSTEEQAREGRASLPAQRARIEAYAAEQGLEIVEWYEDAGVSAYKETANREGFNSAIGRALAGDVQAFLVIDLSRFYRDSYKAAHYFRLLEQSGVTVHTITQQHDTSTPEGELMQWLNMGLARLESRQNAARVIRAQKQNLEMRDPETGWAYQNGGQPLFGYAPLRRPAGRNRKGAIAYKQLWVLDESAVAGKERWEWAREMLERRQAGASYDALAKWLTEEGVPPLRGSYWPRSTLCYLFRKPALLRYAGRALWNVHDNHGKLKPEADWVIVEHGQPAIIDDAKLDALIALGQRQRHEYQQPATPKSYPSPYQGRFFCARCGSRMSLWRDRGRTYYVCSSRKYSPVPCGGGKLLRREQVEGGVTRWIAERLEYPEGLRTEVARCEKQLRNLAHTVRVELGRLAKRKVEVENKLASWMRSANPESPIWDDIEKRLRELRLEANKLEAAITALESNPREAIKSQQDAYIGALDLFGVALEGDSSAMVAVGKSFVERLEWDPVTEEVRLTLYRTPPGTPQVVVAPRGFEPLLPE